MEGVAIASLALMAAGAGYSAYSSYQQGQAQNRYNRSMAEITQAEAEANAAELERQAQISEERAAVAQLQGEQEAANRSRQLAAAIGSTYANWAGNGLLVDGSSDTLGSVLTAQATEAQADISTIRDNAAINVWNYEEEKKSLLVSAANTRTSGLNQAAAYRAAGGMAAAAGTNAAIGTAISGVGNVGLGYASAATKYGVSGQTSVWNPTGTTSKIYTSAK